LPEPSARLGGGQARKHTGKLRSPEPTSGYTEVKGDRGEKKKKRKKKEV